jgi:hypothetical protein
MTRIMMPRGHQALCLEGHQYLPDEAGAFNVPSQHAPELIRVHGAVVAPSVNDMLQQAEDLEAKARLATKQSEALTEQAKEVRKNATAEQARIKKIMEERAAAEAAEAAKTEGTKTEKAAKGK